MNGEENGGTATRRASWKRRVAPARAMPNERCRHSPTRDDYRQRSTVIAGSRRPRQAVDGPSAPRPSRPLLVVVVDCYSGAVLGWVLDDRDPSLRGTRPAI